MNKSPIFKTAYFHVWGRRFGVEFSRVFIGELPYLDRWILYIGGLNLRLHKFYRGDDERAPHDHPWWFITFPFKSYTEIVQEFDINGTHIKDGHLVAGGWVEHQRVVRAWRPHFRPAEFRHYVVGRLDGEKKPFWTFVIAGDRSRRWGFWPNPYHFVYYKDWK